MVLDVEININNNKMLDLADKLRKEIPNCGFALIVLELDGENKADYVSNVNDDFMINALEMQLAMMKSRRMNNSNG
jgi:hypothetical protein